MDGLPVAFWDVPHLRIDSSKASGRGTRFPSSPREEDISANWDQLHGSDNWVGLLDPLDHQLRDEILKYGHFSQATYDAYVFDPSSKFCGSCRYSPSKLLDKVGLGRSGYVVTRLLYATVPELPHAPLLSLWLLPSLHIDSWCQIADWIGFVAVSDDKETKRLGRREILVAWRGTCAPVEWYKDAQFRQEPLVACGHGAMVEHGFQSVYTSKSDDSEYTRSSASEQVMAEIRQLVDKYQGEKNEVVSLTVTGHSLGGALALLNAHEAAAAVIPGLSHVSVFSFGAPSVGNAAFVREVAKVGVKLLRVVIKEDMVPKLPNLLIFPYSLTSPFKHAGIEMVLDAPDLHYDWLDLPHCHSLKTYLHLVELAGRPVSQPFLASSFSIVRTPRGRLEDVLRARECWYRMADLGLVQVPEGDPEDVPSPPGGAH